MGVACECECVSVTVLYRVCRHYFSAEKTDQVASGARNHKDRRTVQGTGGGLMDAMSGGSATFVLKLRRKFRVFEGTDGCGVMDALPCVVNCEL